MLEQPFNRHFLGARGEDQQERPGSGTAREEARQWHM